MAELTSKILWTAEDTILTDFTYTTHLWRTCKQLTHISSRQWVWALSAFFRDLDVLHIDILDSMTRQRFEYPDLDMIFLDANCDGRWFRFYLKADSSGLYPFQRPKNISKLRILDLYARATVSKFDLFARAYSAKNDQFLLPQENNGSSPSEFPDLRYLPRFDVFLTAEEAAKEGKENEP